MKHLMICIIAMGLVSCSDFHFAIVPNGSLPPVTDDPDTIRIPADSIIVTNLFATNDTLFQADAGLRANRHIEVPFRLSALAEGMDSVLLYGTVVATDTLQIGLRHGMVTDPIVDMQIESSDNIHHRIRVQVQAGIDYTLVWKSLDGQALQMGAFLLVGYPSKDSIPLHLVDRVSDYLEVLPVHYDTALVLPGTSHFIQELPLESKDSVYVVLQSDSGTSSYLLNQAEFDAFMVNGESPSEFLWQGKAATSTLRWFSETPIHLYYLISNSSSTEQIVSDSITIFRHLQE